MADGAVHIPNATPFDLIEEDASDFLVEVRNWCDGSGVETQAQADEVSRLLDHGRKLAKAADDARKEENRPHDEAKAAVQAKYAPLFADPKTKTPGHIFKALDALKATLAPFLQKQEAAKREVERLAREEADRKAAEAAEAMRQANAANMEAREAAEALLRQAEEAERAAKAAVKDKAHAMGGDRAIGLRSRWVATMADAHEAAGHFWRLNPAAFHALLQKLADDEVRAGKRSIPGFTVTEERCL